MHFVLNNRRDDLNRVSASCKWHLAGYRNCANYPTSNTPVGRHPKEWNELERFLYLSYIFLIREFSGGNMEIVVIIMTVSAVIPYLFLELRGLLFAGDQRGKLYPPNLDILEGHAKGGQDESRLGGC